MNPADDSRDLLLPGLEGAPSELAALAIAPPVLDLVPVAAPVDALVAPVTLEGARIVKPRPKREVVPLTSRPLRFSNLKHIAKSPAHALAALRKDAWVPTPSMNFGTLVHALVLGGKVAAFDGPRRAGAEWKAFQKANRGKLLVSKSELQRARKAARAVRTDPIAGPLVRAARREVEMAWDYCGRACAGRADLIARNGSFVADLKTTTTASPEWFPRMALRAHYHVQLAYYRHGAAMNGLARPDADAFIIAVEPSPPWAVVVYQLSPTALDFGTRSWVGWVERYRVCEASGAWPGYAQSLVDLDVPTEEGLSLVIDGEEIAV